MPRPACMWIRYTLTFDEMNSEKKVLNLTKLHELSQLTVETILILVLTILHDVINN